MSYTMNSARKIAAATLLAAVSTGAQAQSSVTVSGLIDLSVGQTKAPGGVRNRDVDSGKMTTSHIGLQGREDLGDGMAAFFRIEHFLRADTGEIGRFNGDAFWSRHASIGVLSPRWGSITLGRQSTPLFVATLVSNPFGDSFGFSPAIRHYFTSGTATGDSGWNDAIMYSSPTWGGLRFGVQATTDSGAGGRNTGANVAYADGPLSLSLVFQNVEKDGATPVQDTRTWQIAGAYRVGAARLTGHLGKVDNKTTGNSFDIAGFGASMLVFGSGNLLAYYSRISPETGNGRKTFSAGYDYFLSKRTDLYLVAMSDKVDNLSSGHGYSLGLRHRF